MRLTISKKDVLCFVLLLSPLEPRFFELNAMIQRIYTMVMFFSAAYLGIQYLKNRRRPANVALIIVLLQVWLLLSTVLNHGLINSTVIRCVKFFVLCLTVDYFSDDLSRLLRCLMLHFEIYTYSNLVAYILFPGGLVTRENYAGGVSAEWVLGWHHYFKIWFIPGLLVAWLYRDYFKKSKRCYLLTAAIIITESFWGASTGLTGAILFVILLIIPKIKSILTPVRATFLAAFFIITIVFLQKYDYLTLLLSSIYSDNLDFSGRLVIWSSAIQAFTKSPLFGYGIRASTTDVVRILGLGAWATHCHNHILQIMFEGGILSLVMFVGLLYVNIKSCAKAWRNSNFNASRICMYSIFVYLIIGVTEHYEYAPMYLILILPFYFCNKNLDELKINGLIKC